MLVRIMDLRWRPGAATLVGIYVPRRRRAIVLQHCDPLTHFGEQQRRGEERDIDDVQFPLRGFIDHTSRGEHVSCRT